MPNASKTLCPSCKTEINNDEAVAMLLTPVSATKRQRENAVSALVHICPKCHILFLDNEQYEWVESQKREWGE